MEFRVLGPLEVVGDDGPIALGGPKQRAVLAHLILRANHVVPADLLIDELWGEDPPETARNTLQTYVYRLRRLLGDGRLEGGDGGYVLRAQPEEIDASRFEAGVKDAKALASADPRAAAAAFGEALALWRGAPLADLAEEPLLRGEIARLEELRLSATERRIAAEIAVGGHSTVVSELEALTTRYPLRERMWASLMLALYRSGRQAEALSTYQRARDVLADELGTEPSPELQRLHEQILRGDLALDAPGSPRPVVRASRLDLEPDTEFAGYRIVSTLGRGGMSVVYLAEHEWLQRRVALKVLAPQLAEDESFRERFVRESRLAASLDHPNVIPIFEAGASGADLYIAMRYVEGTDLRSLLQEQGELAPTRVAAIVRQIAAGLDAAHEEGLVHRDVKPGNVLIARARGTDAGEHVYLSDFGLTRRSTSESGVTGTGQFVGTLDYAAPEQFAGGTLDARTDVYSLGCVLYECLTGHPPFRAENDAGLMYAHLQADPPRATDDRPQLPKRIDTIVAMAMAKAPTARYQTAGALADEAVRALAPGEPSGPSGTQPGAIVRWLLPVAAVAVALIAGIVLSSVLRGDTPAGGDQGLPTSSASPSPSPTIAPLFRTVDRPLTSEEERLFSYVPEDVSSDCHPLDRDEPVQGEIAAIACRAEGVEVLYEAFPTRDLMDEAFQVNLNISGASPGECATDKVAVTPYTVDEQPAGRVLCYTTDVGQLTEGVPRRSHIEWTDENASIYAHVVRNDLGDLSLYEWWLSSAGPLIPGSGAGSGQKDRPDVVADRHLEDGVYLTSLSCGGFSNATCSLRIAGDRYEIAFTGDPGPIEIGTVLLRKPDLVLFAPETGECFDPEVPGEAPPSQPALFEWSVEGDELSFERTSGGRCAGPQGLTDDPWTRAPAGQLVVEAGDDLIVTDAAGEILTSLTDEAETLPNSWPDWSSDGSEVVFSGADAEGFDLYTVSGDGTGLSRLTDVEGDEVTPAWSPDGSKILYAFDGRSGPVVSGIEFVNPDGSGATQVFAGPEGGGIFQPLWSPDGTQIAFSLFTSAGPAPYVVNADGSDAGPITEGFGVPVGWTPDGQIIVFRDGALSAIAPDGSDESVYLAELPGGVTRPVLDRSPDGQWLAISDASTQGNGVFLVSADGSKVFAIGPGVEPDWRPPTG